MRVLKAPQLLLNDDEMAPGAEIRFHAQAIVDRQTQRNIVSCAERRIRSKRYARMRGCLQLLRGPAIACHVKIEGGDALRRSRRREIAVGAIVSSVREGVAELVCVAVELRMDVCEFGQVFRDDQ